MRIYKKLARWWSDKKLIRWCHAKLTRWWRNEYGGEWQGHADFIMTEGDTFASAFYDLFAENADKFWMTPISTGKVRKVHILFSFAPEEDVEEEGSENDRCLTT